MKKIFLKTSPLFLHVSNVYFSVEVQLFELKQSRKFRLWVCRFTSFNKGIFVDYHLCRLKYWKEVISYGAMIIETQLIKNQIVWNNDFKD